MIESLAIPAGLVLLGWGLGFLNTFIVEKRRQAKQQREYMKAYVADLQQLRARLVIACYRATQRFGKFDRRFIDWFLRSVEQLGDVDVVVDKELMLRLKELSEVELAAYIESSNKKAGSGGLSYRKYIAPFLMSNLHAVQWFDPPISIPLLDIVAHVHMLHELIDESRQGFWMTFKKEIGENNLKTINNNLDDNYRTISEQQLLISDKIGAFIKQYG